MHPAPTDIYTLSLHDALPIFFSSEGGCAGGVACAGGGGVCDEPDMPSLKLRMPSPRPFITSGMRLPPKKINTDRKSTRLNSSHTVISYAVFCLKKKKKKQYNT